MTTRKKITYAVAIGIIFFLIYAGMSALATARLKAVDPTHISDVRNLELALELFHDANGSFPMVGSCSPIDKLKPFLEVYAPGQVYPADSPPMSMWESVFSPKAIWFYRVGSSNDGMSMVLLTKLNSVDEFALEEDVDGSVLGCDCNDPNFCVGLGKDFEK